MAFFIIEASAPTPGLQVCLGQYELNYFSEGGQNVCTKSDQWINRAFCHASIVAYVFLSSNIAEAFLLYKCMKMIQKQTESSRTLISEKEFIKRRTYVKRIYVS